jgi:hypothetical protein
MSKLKKNCFKKKQAQLLWKAVWRFLKYVNIILYCIIPLILFFRQGLTMKPLLPGMIHLHETAKVVELIETEKQISD